MTVALTHPSLSPTLTAREIQTRFNYVKDYDGGTHMECYVHPTVPYMNQADMFERQGKFLRERIADISTSKVVYPGLTEEQLNSLDHPINIPGAGLFQQ